MSYSSFVEYLSKSVTNDWLNCVAKSLREQTVSYGISQIPFHFTEIRYQPKLMKIFEFLETSLIVPPNIIVFWCIERKLHAREQWWPNPRSANSLHSSQNSSIFGTFLNGSSFTYLLIVKKPFTREGWYLYTKKFFSRL